MLSRAYNLSVVCLGHLLCRTCQSVMEDSFGQPGFADRHACYLQLSAPTSVTKNRVGNAANIAPSIVTAMADGTASSCTSAHSFPFSVEKLFRPGEVPTNNNCPSDVMARGPTGI